MDEKLKAILLLNSLDSSGFQAWEKFKLKKIPPRALWEDSTDFMRFPGVSESAISLLKDRVQAKWAEREYEKCSELGIRIITIEDKNFPEKLRDLKDPPLMLYWYGNADSLTQNTIGVVGTRRASLYGRRIAQSIGECCTRYKIGLISGGASGIDGNAHTGACRTGGSTFAVFGTGIDVIFPTAHKMLFEDIREKGALISEFPLGTAGEPWRFPKRNRIVAALSEKLIVVEAPVKSGAMITARMALELNREIWAVPGRIDEDAASGSNRLIFDGAYPFIDNESFFSSQFGQSLLFSDIKSPQSFLSPPGVSAQDASIIELLRIRGERTVDNIALEVKMSAADVFKSISILLAKGIICSSGSGRFSLKV